MTLIKTTLLSSISPLLRVLTGLVSTKVFAVMVGPTGLPIIGQLNNLVSLVTGLTSGGVSPGLTKLLAEDKHDTEKHKVIVSTAGFLILGSSALAAAILVAGSPWIAAWVLTNPAYYYVILTFALTLPLYSFKAVTIGILNGHRDIKALTAINVTSQLLVFAVTVGLVVLFGLPGALISVAAAQSIHFAIGLRRVVSKKWLVLKWSLFDKETVGKLLRFMAMALTSALVVPLTTIAVRTVAIQIVGLHQTGLWEALTRISNLFFSVLISAISVYFIPKVSATTDSRLLRREIWATVGLLTPLVLGLSVVLYFGRDLVISVFYTEEFRAMRDLFLWQLLGDVFKSLNWILGSTMIAKAMTKRFIAIEVGTAVLNVALSTYFMASFGLIGIPLAYFVFQVAFACFNLLFFRSLLFDVKRRANGG